MDEYEEVKQRIKHEKEKGSRIDNHKSILDTIATALALDAEFIEIKKQFRKLKEKNIEEMNDLVQIAKKKMEQLNCKVYITKTKEEALEIALKELEGAKLICKSKSNAVNEIGLIEKLEEKGVEVVETDLGDRIIQLTNESPSHPVAPASHLSIPEVAQAFSKYLKIDIESSAIDIVAKSRLKFREKILASDVGLTGANAIAANDGAIILLENEGNISLITRLPRKHLCIVGINKVLPRILDAIQTPLIAERAVGGPHTAGAYISIIRGPSRTADIQFIEVIGMHGAQEVIVIFIDNWRNKVKNHPILHEFLYCINCGTCLLPCTALMNTGAAFSSKYGSGVYGIIKSYLMDGIEAAVKNGLFLCTGCGACKEMCPSIIDLPGILRFIREEATKKELTPPKLREISKNIIETGSPFAEEKKIK
ncbi:MAG: lactate utilization protein [Candidatus Lokiarchaeota archaeon]|nr:lactate utilization protein [Candidatus Lokiarchaeota archaeon]